jgi:D-alanyl-D-alanine carboxypeptidase
MMETLFQLDRRPGTVLVVVLLLLLRFTLAVHAEVQEGKILPISPALCDDMKSHNVMRPESPLSCARLKLISFPYVGFDDRLHSDGEIVVMDAAAEHVLQIFAKLLDIRFPIAKVRLMNHYNGNDSASTADNNTSSFNARKSTGGNSLSMHAYGLAIDLNPVQNPYATPSGSGLRYMPHPGAAYANRSNIRPGMAESVIDVFANQGFLVWGGYWRNPIDYQHFQVSRSMAERLAALSPAQAQAAFRQYVERYRTCRKSAGTDAPRLKCIND